jgi:hypothetical protein
VREEGMISTHLSHSTAKKEKGGEIM